MDYTTDSLKDVYQSTQPIATNSLKNKKSQKYFLNFDQKIKILNLLSQTFLKFLTSHYRKITKNDQIKALCLVTKSTE